MYFLAKKKKPFCLNGAQMQFNDMFVKKRTPKRSQGPRRGARGAEQLRNFKFERKKDGRLWNEPSSERSYYHSCLFFKLWVGNAAPL